MGLKTKLHHYCFETGKHPGYKAMVEKIKANSDGRGHWMNSIGDPGRVRGDLVEPNPEDIEIETAHLFANQSNTADGRRVFDWYEEYNIHNHDYLRGHWMEITPEIAQARRSTLSCGWCGCQYGPYHQPAPADGFCDRCLDGPYLDAGKLHLLRLRPVIDDGGCRAELTEDERAALMPRYVERQTTGNTSRAKKARDKERADVIAKYERKSRAEKAEHDGMLWLWEKGFRLDNVIYYSHTEKFSFGWRNPVSDEVRSRLLDVLSEFPFEYEIK